MKAIRIAGGLALAALLMGAACPPTDYHHCYPQQPDQWGNCPEPGRDYGSSEAPSAPAAEPAPAPAAPSPEPRETVTHDYDQKET